jgi:hypothetical protein
MLGINLRLHFRNRLALLYGYLFPTLFLLAFWVLYRFEPVPLVRHMGELLTVTILGGACFGLPTAMVAERERGVWRRYRVAPVSTAALLGTTVVARYVLLLLAGLLQIALAMALGMPYPRHPADLAAAFTCVAFAFLGLGLLIAMLANTVPAVQALGQCVFLPLLIIGGVAVPLARLPPWAQELAAFFPGAYAVEAIDAAVRGDGLAEARFSLMALLLIGAAACLSAARLFRWDPRPRTVSRRGYGWIAVALGAWAAVGLFADRQGRVPAGSRDVPAAAKASTPVQPDVPLQPPNRVKPHARLSPQERAASPAPNRETATADAREPTAATRPRTVETPDPVDPPGASTWQAVTRRDIERDLFFAQLPPDSGIITPVAAADEPPEANQVDILEHLRRALVTWKPGQSADPVQRARNLLYVAGVADIQQLVLERHIPLLILDRLQTGTSREDLIKILYWVAIHPEDGSVDAIEELQPLRLERQGFDIEELRNRAAIYATKFVQRLIANPSVSGDR